MTNCCDVLIVGGGILGLWAAKYASDAGLKTVLVDKGKCGAAGSHGLMGALSPHLPNAMNEKKLFQLHALHELSGLIASLEEETGLSTGYRQCGRLMPIRLEGFKKRVEKCTTEALVNWDLDGGRYRFERLETADFDQWINPELAPMGLAYDSLSARAAPRLVTRALKAGIANRVEIIEGFEFSSFEEKEGRVVATDGRSVIAKNIIFAAGFQTYDLLKNLMGGDLGDGVKGHSGLFRLAGVADMPILYDNGTYVIPHDDGTVAVGSTSEEAWTDEYEVERKKCASFLERSLELCPLLQDAELLDLWAGVRPRSRAKEPIVGRLFTDRNIFVLTGGFKISFGIAHRLAQALIERMVGQEDVVALPESYEVGYHLREAEKRKAK